MVQNPLWIVGTCYCVLFSNNFIIEWFKASWNTPVTIDAGGSNTKTINMPLSVINTAHTTWTGIANVLGVILTTSELTTSKITFRMYNSTNASKTVDRVNIMIIGH